MTEYERGFNEGFAAALQRSGKASCGNGFNEGPRKKLAVSFSEEEFSRVAGLAKHKGISLGAAVREMIGLYA